VQSLDISAIKADLSIQGRAAINQKQVDEYSDRMKAGDNFPPLVVFHFDSAYWLADGFHRHQAAGQAALTEFEVEVRQGNRKDAIKHAIQANTSHGLARTNADKKRAVLMALEEFPHLSDRAIADLAKVSHPFVGDLRKQLETVTSCPKRTGRDGKARKTCQKQTSATYSQETGSTESEGTKRAGESDNTGKPEPFSSGQAWDRIEAFLFGELKNWPETHRRTLAERLRKFADCECV